MQPKYPVKLVKKGRSHFYSVIVDGTEHLFPGVTGILSTIAKPALVPWATKMALQSVQSALSERMGPTTIDQSWIDGLIATAKKQPDKIKDDAADLGTQVHKFVDLINKGEEPSEVPPEIADPVNAFKSWRDTNWIEIVMGDTPVASLLHGYGGSLDMLGKRGDDYILLDLKTSNGCYAEMALQVAAYAQAAHETLGARCKEAMILRVSKTAPVEFEVKQVADLDNSFRAFLAAKELKGRLAEEQFA